MPLIILLLFSQSCKLGFLNISLVFVFDITPHFSPINGYYSYRVRLHLFWAFIKWTNLSGFQPAFYLETKFRCNTDITNRKRDLIQSVINVSASRCALNAAPLHPTQYPTLVTFGPLDVSSHPIKTRYNFWCPRNKFLELECPDPNLSLEQQGNLHTTRKQVLEDKLDRIQLCVKSLED
ncbi:hypothetical protein DINM_000267, partial [Dirofilaria immitis]|nr:hypothetical protein [Dirofilaria immitis]